jgi:hypothetical protein
MALRAQCVPAQVTLMKRLLLMGLIGAGMWVVTARAQEKFSQAVRPEEFAAAGLSKLSPEERARLDTLVEAYKSGALAAARAEVATAAAARATAEQKAAKAEAEVVATKAAAAAKPKPTGESFLAKAKVLLTPGTEVEYETVQTKLLGEFRGWQTGTVFNLENGQRWRVESGSYITSPEAGPRKVRIVPGLMGSFFLEIEGVRQRPKIKFVGGGK